MTAAKKVETAIPDQHQVVIKCLKCYLAQSLFPSCLRNLFKRPWRYCIDRKIHYKPLKRE